MLSMVSFEHFPCTKGLDLFLKQQQLLQQQHFIDTEKKMMGLAFIKHLRLELCHVFAYLWLWVSEKVTVMVLVGQRGFWDVSLTL